MNSPFSHDCTDSTSGFVLSLRYTSVATSTATATVTDLMTNTVVRGSLRGSFGCVLRWGGRPAQGSLISSRRWRFLKPRNEVEGVYSRHTLPLGRSWPLVRCSSRFGDAPTGGMLIHWPVPSRTWFPSPKARNASFLDAVGFRGAAGGRGSFPVPSVTSCVNRHPIPSIFLAHRRL